MESKRIEYYLLLNNTYIFDNSRGDQELSPLSKLGNLGEFKGSQENQAIQENQENQEVLEN